MKILDKIIVSPTPPTSKTVAWFDGKGIKIPNQGKWENTGGSGGSGIEIVESVDKLDPNAPAGSLASVAVLGKIAEVSVRDMEQPNASIINQETGIVNTANLSTVQSISIDPSKVSFDGKDTMLYFCTENINMMEGGDGAMLAVVKQSQGDAQIQGGMYMNAATREQKSYIFVQKDTEETTTVYQDQIDEFIKHFEDDTFYYLGFFENITSGVEITEEDYVSFDNIKVVSGTTNAVEVYQKGNTWEKLHAKKFEDLKSSIDYNTKELQNSKESIEDVYAIMREKSNNILIKSYASNNRVLPNTYTTHTINTTGNINIKLESVQNQNIYNEYIIEITCTSTPSEVSFVNSYGTKIAINWPDGYAPVFEMGYTYIISIVNNFGVFARFVNS